MNKFTVILKNEDGSIYWTQSFETKAAMNQWLNDEQARPQWNKSLKVFIDDQSEAVEAEMKKQKTARDARTAKQSDSRIKIAELKTKKPKTLAEIADALDKIVDFLNPE